MDKSACPSFGRRSCSLDELNEQQDPSTAAPPQCSTSVVRNASMVHQPGGGSPSIYPHQVLLQLNDPLPRPLPVLLPPLRLPPLLALHETPCLKQLEKKAVLPSMPQLMLRLLKLTPATMTMPTAAAEAEVNKATSTKPPIWCKQCMQFMFVLMKRISSSPNHSPQTSAFPNPRSPD